MNKTDWSEPTFDRCVRLLGRIAKAVNLTYSQVNVILFCYMLPVIMAGLLVAIVLLIGGV